MPPRRGHNPTSATRAESLPLMPESSHHPPLEGEVAGRRPDGGVSPSRQKQHPSVKHAARSPPEQMKEPEKRKPLGAPTPQHGKRTRPRSSRFPIRISSALPWRMRNVRPPAPANSAPNGARTGVASLSLRGRVPVAFRSLRADDTVNFARAPRSRRRATTSPAERRSALAEHSLENRVDLAEMIIEVELVLDLLRAERLGDILVGLEQLH